MHALQAPVSHVVRLRRRPRGHWWLRVALVTLTAACTASGPRPIALGTESCGFCRMTITDARFAAEARLARGRTEVFDSIECVAGYTAAGPADAIVAIWVSDFNHPGALIPADSATFWRLDGGVSSPMGKGLLATVGQDAPRGVATVGGPQTWRDVVARAVDEGAHEHGAASNDLR